METSILFLIQIMQNGILFTNCLAPMPAEFCSWVHLVQNKLHQVIDVISLSLTFNYTSKRNYCILRLQRNLFSSALLVFCFDYDNVAKVFLYGNIYQTSEIDKLIALPLMMKCFIDYKCYLWCSM